MASASIQIPVIDFQPFITGNANTRQAIAQQIFQACHAIGFMYLQNPGIELRLIDKLFAHSKIFFDLPFTIKHQLAWSNEFSNRGYIGIERECLAPDQPGDFKEAFNVGKEVSDTDTAPAAMLINNWHPEQEDFRTCVLSFWDACTDVVDSILQAFALALQLPEDFFTTKHNQQNHTLRLLHYPPLQIPPKPGQMRAGAHSAAWQYNFTNSRHRRLGGANNSW